MPGNTVRMFKPNTPGRAARCIVVTLGWILTACSSDDQASGSHANGAAGSRPVIPPVVAHPGTGGTPATLGPASGNTSGLAGATSIGNPNGSPVTGQAGAAAPPLGS